MSEDHQDRRARIAAVLEKQFDECSRAAGRLLTDMSGERPDYFNMPIALALLRIGDKIGNSIARLEEQAAAASEKSRSRGSIPT